MVIRWAGGGDAMGRESWKTAQALLAQSDEFASQTPKLVLSAGTFKCVAKVEIAGRAAWRGRSITSKGGVIAGSWYIKHHYNEEIGWFVCY